MKTERFLPLVDRTWLYICVPTALLLIAATVISLSSVGALILMLAADIFTFYFLLAPLSSYVELRERGLFIQYGLVIKREIPYESIREIKKESKFYSETMLSIKCAREHVLIKYGKFDVTTVSVKNNDIFIEKIKERIELTKSL